MARTFAIKGYGSMVLVQNPCEVLRSFGSRGPT